MKSNNLKQLDKQMKRANHYEEWYELAVQHDKLSGMEDWKQETESKLYDYKEIQLRLQTLQELREQDDAEGLLFTLNEGIHGNMGGMGKAVLYNKARSGTKQLIQDYVDEVATSLQYIAKTKHRKISLENKMDFFNRASICFGRSALMLSGGGQVGNFHIGVLKALAQQELLPNVISGASAGSFFAALAGTRKDTDLADFLEKKMVKGNLKNEAILYENMVKDKKASVQDLEQVIDRLIPDLTFQEAYKLTGRKINISVAPQDSHQKSRLLNAIASPNVLIKSAVMASCAIPGIFPSVTLQAKNRMGEVQPYLPSRKWVDGSMSNDLPAKRLTRLYGINHFIVSLTNPLVLSFVKDPSYDSELLKSARNLNSTIIKGISQFNYSIAKNFFNFLPKKIAFTASAINSVIQQEYVGDINIMADFSFLKLRKATASWTPEELNVIIEQGEHASWRKLEAIRVTTKIGRVLDGILAEYEAMQLKQRVKKADA